MTAAIAASGCGGSTSPGISASSPKTALTSSAATIVVQLRTAMGSARSVHLAGSLHSQGTTVGLDVSMIRSGAFSGSIDSGGAVLDIVDPGQRVYVMVTNAFLGFTGAPPSACHRACGKFVVAPASLAKTIGGDFTMSKLLGDIRAALPGYVKGGTTTIAGRQAVILHGSDGSTLYVAATGTPYPLRAIAPKTSHSGALNFSEWNAVPAFGAPPASEIISISQRVG